MADQIPGSGTTDGARDHDRPLEDHAAIRRLVRRHGGRPVVEETPVGTERLAVRFPGDETTGTTPIPWAEFFTHFEVKGLALAWSERSVDGGSDGRNATAAVLIQGQTLNVPLTATLEVSENLLGYLTTNLGTVPFDADG